MRFCLICYAWLILGAATDLLQLALSPTLVPTVFNAGYCLVLPPPTLPFPPPPLPLQPTLMKLMLRAETDA